MPKRPRGTLKTRGSSGEGEPKESGARGGGKISSKGGNQRGRLFRDSGKCGNVGG